MFSVWLKIHISDCCSALKLYNQSNDEVWWDNGASNFQDVENVCISSKKIILHKFLCCFEFTLSVGLNVCLFIWKAFSNVISTDKTTPMSRRRILGVDVRKITLPKTLPHLKTKRQFSLQL